MTTHRLKLYVDETWRRPDWAHIALLYPAWGVALSSRHEHIQKLLERHPLSTRRYDIVGDGESADAVLVPYRYQWLTAHDPSYLARIVAFARSVRKPLIIDATGDEDVRNAPVSAIILKNGGYRFLKTPHEITVPPFADDLLELRGGAPILREKVEVPIVGFAGWTHIPLQTEIMSRIREIPVRAESLKDARYLSMRKGIFLRRTLLRALSRSSSVRLNVLARSSFSGGSSVPNAEELRRQFIENALSSDICLDVRGDGNYSIRLIEILSLGRVPLIIDTERNLPFADRLDYSTFALIMPAGNPATLADRIRTAYDAISKEEWARMQIAARDAYVRYLRSDSVMDWLVEDMVRTVRSYAVHDV